MLIQWHTEDNSPIEQNNGKEELFEVPFGDVVCVYGKATPKEKRHINRLRGWLEKKIYRPVGPPYFEELIARAPAEDMQRKSIVDVFVETATWDELINAAYETQFDWQEQHVKKEKNDCLGRPERIYKDRTMPLSYHDPINNFGIVRETKLLHGYEYVISTYACCGQPTTHPGCWIHPTKVIQAYNPAEGFGDRIWEELLKNSSMNIEKFWNDLKPVIGTKWLNPYYYTQLDKYIQQMKPKVAPVVEIMFKEEYKEMNTSSGEHTIDLFRTLKNDQRMIWETFLQLIKDYNSIFCGNSRDEVEEIFKLREVGLNVWTKSQFEGINLPGGKGKKNYFKNVNNAATLLTVIDEIKKDFTGFDTKFDNIKRKLAALNALYQPKDDLDASFKSLKIRQDMMKIFKDEIEADYTKYNKADISIDVFKQELTKILRSSSFIAKDLDNLSKKISKYSSDVEISITADNNNLRTIETKLAAYEKYISTPYDTHQEIAQRIKEDGADRLQKIIDNENPVDYPASKLIFDKTIEINKYNTKKQKFITEWENLQLPYTVLFRTQADNITNWTSRIQLSKYYVNYNKQLVKMSNKLGMLLATLVGQLQDRIQEHKAKVEQAENIEKDTKARETAKKEVDTFIVDTYIAQLNLSTKDKKLELIINALKDPDIKYYKVDEKKIREEIAYAYHLNQDKLDALRNAAITNIKVWLTTLEKQMQTDKPTRLYDEAVQKAQNGTLDVNALKKEELFKPYQNDLDNMNNIIITDKTFFNDLKYKILLVAELSKYSQTTKGLTDKFNDAKQDMETAFKKLAQDIQNFQNDRGFEEVKQKAAAMAFDYNALTEKFGVEKDVLNDPFGSEVYVQKIQNLLLILNIIEKEKPKYANLLNDKKYNDKLVELGDIYNKLQEIIKIAKQAQWKNIPNEVRRWLELTDRDAFIKESYNALEKWNEYYNNPKLSKNIPKKLAFMVNKTRLRDDLYLLHKGDVYYIYTKDIDLKKLKDFLIQYFKYVIRIAPEPENILGPQPVKIKKILEPLQITKTTKDPPEVDENVQGMFNKDAIEWIKNDNSCWVDSVFFSLFGYVGISLVKDIFKATTLYVEATSILYDDLRTEKTTPSCSVDEVKKLHDTIVDDIFDIQKTPVPNERCKLKTLNEWFETKCIPITWKPEKRGYFYYPHVVMHLLKELYNLEKCTFLDKLNGNEEIYCKEYEKEKFYWEENNYICGSIIFGSSPEGGHFLNFMYDFYIGKWFYVDAKGDESNRFEYQGIITNPEEIPYVVKPTVMLKPSFVFYYHVDILQNILNQKRPKYLLATRLQKHGAYKSGESGSGGDFTTTSYDWKSLYKQLKDDPGTWRKTVIYLMQNGITPGTHRFKSYVHSFIEPNEVVSWGHFVDKEELDKIDTSTLNPSVKMLLDENVDEQAIQFLTWMFPPIQDAGTNNGNSSIVNQNFETAQYNWNSLFVNGKYNVEMWSKTVVYFVENGITPGTFRFKCYVHKFIEPEQIVSLGHFVIEQDIIDTTIPGNLQTLLEISYKSGGGDAEMLALTNALSTV